MFFFGPLKMDQAEFLSQLVFKEFIKAFNFPLVGIKDNTFLPILLFLRLISSPSFLIVHFPVPQHRS